MLGIGAYVSPALAAAGHSIRWVGGRMGRQVDVCQGVNGYL